MPGKNPGASIKRPDVYEALRKKGYSKEKAAAISNAQSDAEPIPAAAQKLTGKKKKAYTAASNKAKRKGLHPKLAHRAGMNAAKAASNDQEGTVGHVNQELPWMSQQPAGEHPAASYSAGDECMIDGAPGTLQQQDGGLVCVPNLAAGPDSIGGDGSPTGDDSYVMAVPSGTYPWGAYPEGMECVLASGALGRLVKEGTMLVCRPFNAAPDEPGGQVDPGDGIDDEEEDAEDDDENGETEDGWLGDREFTAEQRQELEKKGHAMPGGAFPISSKADLANARQALGRAKNRAATIAHIKKRAKALGVKLPPDWPNDADGFGDAWTEEARAAAAAARQHSAAADRHNLHANQFSKSVEEKGAHKDAAAAHREAANHFERASGAFRRGAAQEAAQHMQAGRNAASLATLSSENAGARHFFRGKRDAAVPGPSDPDTDEHTLSPGEKISEKAKARRKARGRHPDDGFSDGVTLYDSHVVKDGEHYSVTDTIVLDRAAVHRRGDGYVAARPRVARTGIQLYRGDELGSLEKIVRVYRPAAAVFNRDSMSTFSTRPITSDHPPEMVDASNWKQYAVGYTGEDVARDGEYIRVPMTLCDAQTIQEFDAGKRELSVGYSCDLDWTGGVTDAGEKYDAAQRDIKVNHIAFVARARGGSNLTFGDTNGKGDDAMLNLRTIAVDGKPVQVPETAADQILRTLAMQDSVISKLKADAKKKDPDEDEDDDEDEDSKDSKTVDAANATIATLTKQLAELRDEISKLNSPQQRDADMREYMDAVVKAKQVLGDDIKIDPKATAADIKKMVVTARMGDEAAKWSADAVEASFRTLTNAPQNSAGYKDAAAFISGGLQNGGRPGFADTRGMSPSDKAYYEMVDGMQNAWRGENWGKDAR